jgi:hypothetical protein
MGGRSAIPPRRRPADALIAMFPLPCGRVRRGFVRRQNQPGLTACRCANRDRRRRITRGCAIRGRGRRSLLALPWPRELLRRWRRRGSHPALLRGRAGAPLRSASDGAGPSGLGVLYRPPAPRQLCLRPSVAGMGVSVEQRAMIGPARLAWTLAALALASCGGRLNESAGGDAGAVDGYPSFDDAYPSLCPQCPAPADVHRSESCVAIGSPCELPPCPSADPPPPCGSPLACTCVLGIWSCPSPSASGCLGACPSPSSVSSWASCSLPTDLACPSATGCSCTCNSFGAFECSEDCP